MRRWNGSFENSCLNRASIRKINFITLSPTITMPLHYSRHTFDNNKFKIDQLFVFSFVDIGTHDEFVGSFFSKNCFAHYARL